MKWFFAVFSLFISLLVKPLAAHVEVRQSRLESAIPFSEPLQKLLEYFGISKDVPFSQVLFETQKLWLQKGKERWEFDARYESLKPQLWPLFEEMGLLKQIKPKKSRYDYALVHGALLSRVKERVDYLTSLYQEGIRFDSIVFLTGARPLEESEKKQLEGLRTEREMAEWVYERSHLPKEIPVLFIDAPMKSSKEGVLVRPQTADTVFYWLKTGPQPGSCLAISNQPYVAYQDAVIHHYLPDVFELETAGPAASGSPSVAILLDTIAKEIYEKAFSDDLW